MPEIFADEDWSWLGDGADFAADQGGLGEEHFAGGTVFILQGDFYAHAAECDQRNSGFLDGSDCA